MHVKCEKIINMMLKIESVRQTRYKCMHIYFVFRCQIAKASNVQINLKTISIKGTDFPFEMTLLASWISIIPCIVIIIFTTTKNVAMNSVQNQNQRKLTPFYTSVFTHIHSRLASLNRTNEKKLLFLKKKTDIGEFILKSTQNIVDYAASTNATSCTILLANWLKEIESNQTWASQGTTKQSIAKCICT